MLLKGNRIGDTKMTLLENNYSGFNTSRNEGRSKLDQNKMKMSSNMIGRGGWFSS